MSARLDLNRGSFLITLGAALLCALPAYGATSHMIIRELSQPPNYAQTTDRDDPKQLRDGATMPFPMWVHRGAVGWTHVSPIMLSIEMEEDAAAASSPRMGVLRIHTAKGSYAGVDIPRHIDVYAQDSSARYHHAGSLSPASSDFADKANHWITIPLNVVARNILVIIHAGGDFLFIDELEWQDQGAAAPASKNHPIFEKSGALADSIRRVRALLMSRADTVIQPDVLPVNATEIRLWAQDPWSDRISALPDMQNWNVLSTLAIEGIQSEYESACIGFVPGAGLNGQSVQISVRGLPPQAVQAFHLQSVLTATGQMVFDPLVPIGPANVLTIGKSEAYYVWFTFNLNQIGPGTHRISIALTTKDGRELGLLPGNVEVKASSRSNSRQLKAINWAYLRDVPIWKDPDIAFRDLLDHGINVFVIHPADIPGLALNGAWNIPQASHFSKTLELSRGKGMVLLYLGWSMANNPLGLTASHRQLSTEARNQLSRWLDRLSAHLQHLGITPTQWALYPIDEPRGSGLEFLHIVADAIKAVHPEIQIYADPTFGDSGRTTAADLLPLKNVIDIWQPSLRLIQEGGHAFFHEQHKEWWLYHNPTSPAKLGSPLQNYRLLSWWAWHYGAQGIGFWSYSDTDGSSAWNDLDGRYPDWAVVYEGAHSVVSSRRWEAFREGLEDYRLLSLLDPNTAHSIVPSFAYGQPSSPAHLARWSSQDLVRARHSLLQQAR